mmetsp:Transcript_8732/g.24082  ORF Transcript_8732/g.24082 Transcript_8732/m.24082 type:complete len:293 (+) Transcript_8732:521-1399(+)
MMPKGEAVPVSKARRLPCSLRSRSPANGLYESKTVSITTSPRVAVSMRLRMPMSARVGMIYSMVDMAFPSEVSTVFMLCISPLRRLRRSMHAPEYSSGTEISTFSKGSHFWPSISLTITDGGPMKSSKPSRRMFSTSTERWSWPRPDTSYVSALSVSSTRRATLRSSSFIRRSRITRLVSSLPSFPAKGDLFTPNVMRTVGSSTSMGLRGLGSAGSVSVSPIWTSGKPVTTTISPALASSTGVRPIASYTNTSPILLGFLGSTSGRASTAWLPALMDPWVMRPMPILPLKSS